MIGAAVLAIEDRSAGFDDGDLQVRLELGEALDQHHGGDAAADDADVGFVDGHVAARAKPAPSSQGLRTHGRHANRAIGVAADARVVTEVVGVAAAEVVRHQIGDDVLAVGTAGKIADVGGLERSIEQLAADVDRQRAKAAAARLRGLLQRASAD